MISLWRKIVVTIGYCFAGLIILAALLVSVTSLLTPVLNDHRADFENYAATLANRPIKINDIRISWNIYEPELSFNQVTVLNKETLTPVLQIPRIKINLSIWRSLLERKIILDSIKIVGVRLIVHQQTSGQFQVEGLNGLMITDNSTQQSLNTGAVFDWIFSQPRLILQQIDIRYLPISGPERSVTLDRLVLENDGTDHVLMGRAALNQEIPTHVDMNATWKGSISDLPHVSADLYFYLEGVSLPQWFGQETWHDLQIKQGLGSAKIWANWNNNTWQKIQTSLQFYDIQAQSSLSKKPIAISRLSGDFGWKRSHGLQMIAGDNVLIDLPNHLWPTTFFSVTYTPATQTLQAINIGYLDLSDSAALAKASGLLPADYASWLSTLDPKGEVKNFQATWNGKSGDLKLDSQHVAINLNKIFSSPMQFDQLTGLLSWQNDNGTWTVKMKDLKAANADLNAAVTMTLVLPQGVSPTMDLTGNFAITNAGHISRYLPVKTFDPDLVEWLQGAFLSGQIVDGFVTIKGKLSDFPFDNNTGTFSVGGKAKAIDLSYAPDWPVLRNVDGRLLFSGRKMDVDVDSAMLLDIPVYHVHAEIPYLGDDQIQILNVHGDAIKTDLMQGMQFVQQSPLRKTLGKQLSALKLEGPAQLKLGLSVPLKKPDQTKVTGDVDISNATLTLPDWNLVLDKLNGTFHFTEDTMSATGLTGQLFTKPVTLDLKTVQTGKFNSLEADLNGDMDLAALQTWLELPLSQVMQGTTRYQAVLNLPSQTQVAKPTQITIKSDLKGVAVDLAAPYGKKAQDSLPLQVDMEINTNQPLKIKLSYNKLFTAAMTLRRVHQKLSFLGGNLHLGNGAVDWPTQSGIIITGNLDKLDWNTIQPYISQLSSKKSNAFLSPDLFRGIDINFNTINLAGLKLSRTRVQVNKAEDSITIGLTNATIAGQIILPWPLSNSKTVRADFQRLYFAPSGGETKSTINPTSLPPISFVGQSVRYGDADLGRVTFDLVPAQNGVLIKQIAFDQSAYTLHAEGEWRASGSHLRGDLTAPNVNKAFTALGINSNNLVGSTGDLHFDLSWPGAPFALSMNRVVGKVGLKLGKGRIINLDESTNAKMGFGRLLNVLSLQSLPRRLSLDFSDLFEKGYSFDYMKGGFSLRNGSAYTENMRLDGPVARIDLAGRIGVVAKDLDMKLSVTAYVTASLPIVATIATANPIAGIATWAVGKLMSHEVSKITTYDYTITGSWDNPIWNQVGAKKQM